MSTKVRIGSKEYGDAFQNGWLPSLEIYILLVKRFSGNKRYYHKPKAKTEKIKYLAKEIGMSFTQVNKHLNLLVKKGLVQFFSTEIRLSGNNDFKKGISKKIKYVFIPEKVNEKSKIKKLLKALPLYSHLKLQQKVIRRKEHYINIYDLAKKGKYVHFKKYKSLKRYLKNGGSLKVNKHLTASVNKIKQVLNLKSRHTIVSIKKLLKEYGIVDYSSDLILLKNNVSVQMYKAMKDVGVISKHSFFRNNKVFTYESSRFSLPKS